MTERTNGLWPAWLPDAARHYLAHTETGEPIRALARAADVHASTVMRQVRRFEARRDDPLVDSALRELAVSVARKLQSNAKEPDMIPQEIRPTPSAPPLMNAEQLSKEAIPVLRALSEPGAILAIADAMEMAVVVREDPSGQAQRNASVPRELAQAMALKEWIDTSSTSGRVARYHITQAGRAWLRGAIAASENSAQGFAEGQAEFFGASEVSPRKPATLPESPVAMLARRREKDGAPFLSREMVRAAERLREDFELTQIGARVTQDWGRYLTTGTSGAPVGSDPSHASGADARLRAALEALGPGLGDVVLRCCCHLEGLESTEKRMGWSARSGKIVLRIALQHLAEHYASQNEGNALIG